MPDPGGAVMNRRMVAQLGEDFVWTDSIYAVRLSKDELAAREPTLAGVELPAIWYHAPWRPWTPPSIFAPLCNPTPGRVVTQTLRGCFDYEGYPDCTDACDEEDEEGATTCPHDSRTVHERVTGWGSTEPLLATWVKDDVQPQIAYDYATNKDDRSPLIGWRGETWVWMVMPVRVGGTPDTSAWVIEDNRLAASSPTTPEVKP